MKEKLHLVDEASKWTLEWRDFPKKEKDNCKKKLNDAASFALEVAKEFDFITKSEIGCSCHVEDKEFWRQSMDFAKNQTEMDNGEQITSAIITIETVKKFSNYMQYFLARIYNRIRLYIQNLPKIFDKTTDRGIKKLLQDSGCDSEAEKILTAVTENKENNCPRDHILGVIYQNYLKTHIFDWVRHQLDIAQSALDAAKEAAGIQFDNSITLLYHFEKHGVPEFFHNCVDQYMGKIRQMWIWSAEASNRRVLDSTIQGKVSVTQEVVMRVQKTPGTNQRGLVTVQTCFIKRE